MTPKPLMVVDSKQLNKGAVSLSKTNEGLQLSEDWLENVLVKTHDSEVARRLEVAMREGRVETYVAAADKTAGTMSLIKVNAN